MFFKVMTKLVLILLCLAIQNYQLTSSQCLRPPPYNVMNRPMPEFIEAQRIVEMPRLIEGPRLLDTPIYIETPRMINPTTVIAEQPYNSIMPYGNIPPPSTTIITDCTPAVCKNLANTIQMMIVCNLLQNTKGGPDVALQLASPILNEIMANSVMPCGCSSPISPNYVTPNMVPPNVITPTIVSPSMITPNYVTPNMMAPNVVSPNMIAPNMISAMPNPAANNIQSASSLLSNLMALLGNKIQM